MASEVYHRRASSRDVELAPDRQDRVRKKKSSRLELFDLPAEILWRILGIFCNDPVEVVSISLVCKAFRQMTNNEQLWQRVCLNRFGFVAPETVSMSGSWMTVMRDKTAIENSPWIVKPKECAQLVYNDLLGTSPLVSPVSLRRFSPPFLSTRSQFQKKKKEKKRQKTLGFASFLSALLCAAVLHSRALLTLSKYTHRSHLSRYQR